MDHGSRRDRRRLSGQPRHRAEQVRGVRAYRRRVDVGGSDPLARRHRESGPAHAGREAITAARRRGPSLRIRHAALLLGVRRRARAVQCRGPFCDLRRHREAAQSPRARRPAYRHRGAPHKRGARVVLVAYGDARKPGGTARQVDLSIRSPHQDSRAGGRGARRHRRAHRPDVRPRRDHARERARRGRVGTRREASRSACCS